MEIKNSVRSCFFTLHIHSKKFSLRTKHFKVEEALNISFWRKWLRTGNAVAKRQKITVELVSCWTTSDLYYAIVDVTKQCLTWLKGHFLACLLLNHFWFVICDSGCSKIVYFLIKGSMYSLSSDVPDFIYHKTNWTRYALKN